MLYRQSNKGNVEVPVEYKPNYRKVAEQIKKNDFYAAVLYPFLYLAYLLAELYPMAENNTSYPISGGQKQINCDEYFSDRFPRNLIYRNLVYIY